MVEPNRRQDASIGCVLQFDFQARRLPDRSAEVHVGPFEIWRKHQMAGIWTAREGDPDALDFLPAAASHQRLNAIDQLLYGDLRGAGCWERLLGTEFSIHVRQCNHDLSGTDIDPDDYPVVI